jgi:hypothetical protein
VVFRIALLVVAGGASGCTGVGLDRNRSVGAVPIHGVGTVENESGTVVQVAVPQNNRVPVYVGVLSGIGVVGVLVVVLLVVRKHAVRGCVAGQSPKSSRG